MIFSKTIISMIELIIFIFFIIVIGLIGIYSVITGISPMPSSSEAKKVALSEIQHLVKRMKKPYFTLYELGAGWGGIAFMLAKAFPQAKLIAYELSPIPYLYMQLIKKFTKLENLILKRQSFLDISFKDADILFAYLYKAAMPPISDKFKNESQIGTYLISNSFACYDLKLIRSIHLQGFLSHDLLIYQK